MSTRKLQYVLAVAIIMFASHAHAQGPSLAIDSSSGGQLKLSWAGAGFTLEQTARLGSGASWSSANASVSQVNGRTSASIPIGSSSQYFRLRGAGGPTLTTIIGTSPAIGESGVSVNRETIAEFSEALPGTTVL